MEYLTLPQTNTLLREITDPRDLAIVTLILHTGAFLSEVEALEMSDIDWTNRILHIKGTRARDIPLNDQVYQALALWSQDRVDSQVTHLFTTTKGKLNGLSARSIDHIIRTHGQKADLPAPVNAHILRNTFAVRIVSQVKEDEKAADLLGFSEKESLKRYEKPEGSDPESHKSVSPTDVTQNPIHPTNHLDTRSWHERVLEKWFPIKPRPHSLLKPPNTGGNAEEITVGRKTIINDIRLDLKKGQSILLTGAVGIGKTHLLNHMQSVFEHTLYLPTPTPLKPLLTAIYGACSPQTPISSKTRTPEILEKLTQTLPPLRPILMMDNLDNLKQSDVESFLILMDHFTFLAAAEETPDRLDPLWWRFKTISLDALSDEEVQELLHHLTQHLPIKDYEMLETQVVTLANGNPLAVVDMVRQVSYNPVVMPDAVRKLNHEAGIRYRDWSGSLTFFWAILVMFRFIALGTHSFEGYILAGFGTTMILFTRSFIFRKRQF